MMIYIIQTHVRTHVIIRQDVTVKELLSNCQGVRVSVTVVPLYDEYHRTTTHARMMHTSKSHLILCPKSIRGNVTQQVAFWIFDNSKGISSRFPPPHQKGKAF
jgi:hypothetical protein